MQFRVYDSEGNDVSLKQSWYIDCNGSLCVKSYEPDCRMRQILDGYRVVITLQDGHTVSISY